MLWFGLKNSIYYIIVIDYIIDTILKCNVDKQSHFNLLRLCCFSVWKQSLFLQFCVVLVVMKNRRMRLSCSGVKARGNAMPSPRCSNFSARRLLLKEPLPLPSSSPFVFCGYSAICKRTFCYISFCLIVWILKLLPGVSPPTADKTVSAASTAQRHGAGVDAWKGTFVVYYIIIFFQALDCV